MENNLERYRLTKDEYYALRTIFGLVSSYEVNLDKLEERIKTIPGGWRDAKLIASLCNKLLANILRTVPVEKLKMIQKELSHTKILCKVDYDVTGKHEDGFCYVPEQPLEKLIDEVIGYNCLICDKGPDEYKRCEFYKSMKAMYPWNIDVTPEYRGCPFAQL